MNDFPIWPAFAIAAVLLAFVSKLPFAWHQDRMDERHHRVVALDGLRGFLALSVFFHHATPFHGALPEDEWQRMPRQFFNELGHAGVAMFFMVTGFLFWRELLRRQGRQDWVRFFLLRCFRIGPVYLSAIVTVMIIVAVQTRFQPDEAWSELSAEIVRLLALGFFTSPLNGFPAEHILFNAPWTLHFEWLFYLTLPVAALAARRDWSHLPFVVIGLTVSLAFTAAAESPYASIVSLFFIGMLPASLAKRAIREPAFPDWVRSGLFVTLIGLNAAMGSGYSAASNVTLGLAFLLVTSGTTVFGLLTAAAPRRLGEMSYSVYLFHGIVIYLVMLHTPIQTLALVSPMKAWLAIAAAALLTTGAAFAVHVLIERPALSLGHRLARNAGGLALFVRSPLVLRSGISPVAR